MIGGFFQVALTPNANIIASASSLNWQFIIFVTALLLIGVILLIIALLFLRKIRHQNNLIRTGDDGKSTFLITVTKFKSEQEQNQDQSTAQVQEAISLAETFYSALGGLTPKLGFSAWLNGRTDEIALEIVALDELISFYLTVPNSLKQFAEQQIHAQYPGASVEPVTGYNIFSPNGTVVGGYLRTKRQNVLPIKTYKELESDPLNPITNAMSKIPKGDGFAVQYVLRPVKDGWRNTGNSIVSKMQKGESFSDASGARTGFGAWTKAFKATIAKPTEGQIPEPQRQLTQAEQQMMQRIEQKISKAGMEVNIRLVSSAKTATDAQMNLNHVLQAYSQFNIYEFGNAFEKSIPKKLKKLTDGFIYRLFDDRYSLILNTEELASIFHLPGATTETPNIRWMLARIAPAPPEAPSSGDLHIGTNTYRGVTRDIYMNREDRRRHMYIIGKTGSGKSWLMRYMINQDIKNGEGVCVMDPHGDLSDMVMGTIPKHRIDDVVYFNPSDTERPMGLNMLEAPSAADRDFAVQDMISIFMMLFPPEMIGPMFEHSMRNYMLTLMSDMENPGTLAEIPKMVTDEAFQKKWLAKVTDPTVRSFWEDEVANMSDYHKSEMSGYLVSKVGRFVENEMMRNIIGQPKSAFNFREIMDTGKILLINLAKGKTGDVNSNLLGLIIVSKLQMAAFGRADMDEDKRKDFYVYIDEFQNYITPSIATILSEARKYRLNMIMAHQYLAQLSEKGPETLNAVLGNVGNTFVARVGPEDTETLAKIYEPTFSAYDLMNTDSFTWNVKMIAGNAQVKPFTLKGGVAEKSNPELMKSLREISRLTYGRPKNIVEREIAIRSGYGLAKPQGLASKL
ncbi:hypothetical protein CO173_03620 [Candidatus Uhrbacteria bacterium CG_4_9_14_3_um_filter_41_35]|uniref:DUF8128 domain-containing protein n=1 Tax=Candidatus Uhrbacteria bacterium CG_4_9_14_3_um_filter_41_35 TaxID=1975034 RepID=A0A2M7XE35_9BACT|nr:MAG: hypothetical protein COV92_02130 [Candidatus Uhrbacteria bacterium CG11_big_fil_rev_8_21_14_0_20_41_9]PJA46102.1 MAG: hypothetical protein CO173_03620 [Candidatus Uhrbacteria bacterium CG_4_9_14_3_um_filter_41_35]